MKTDSSREVVLDFSGDIGKELEMNRLFDWVML